MPEPELSLLFLRPLNRLGVKYVAICQVSADQIDQSALDEWIDRQDVEAQWKQATG